MVERSNRTIKQLLRQSVWKEWNSDWAERLCFVRMVLNTTRHSSTGCSPYLLWMSRGEEATLPVDWAFGKPDPAAVTCEIEYVVRQRLICQEIAEMVRSHLEQSAERQAVAWENRRYEVHEYAIGDMVWRCWPPHQADKLNPERYLGPYPVLDVDSERYLVLLEVPAPGRNRTQRKWIHVANVKPVFTTRVGELLFVLPSSTS